MSESAKVRIIVADDDRDILDLVVFKLSKAGYDVVSVSDGVAVLAAIEAEPPRLAILDVMMPGLSGLDVLRKVRANEATTFIDPGSPWQNAHIESFNSRLRDEYLNGHLFDSLLEARVLLEDWRQEYNHERLHSSLCYLTPVTFRELWEHQHQERLSLAMAH